MKYTAGELSANMYKILLPNLTPEHFTLAVWVPLAPGKEPITILVDVRTFQQAGALSRAGGAADGRAGRFAR